MILFYSIGLLVCYLSQ